ncbi:penicillin acylase family protein [Catenulispora yoronensis]
MADLKSKRGADVNTWKLGNGHKVMIASLLKSPTLDEGPFPSGGSGRTINSVVSAAPVRHGKTLTGVAVGGASWRMVVDWGTGQSVGIYPGGQSENPASPGTPTGSPTGSPERTDRSSRATRPWPRRRGGHGHSIPDPAAAGMARHDEEP